MSQNQISFDNTAIAFQSKNNGELKQAYFLFKMMNNPSLVKIGTHAASLALNLHLPIKGLIRKTIFKQFCGGESVELAMPTVNHLLQYKVESILDYAVEAKSSEKEFDHTREELIRIIHLAADRKIGFISVKVTGLARFELLEKLQAKQTLNTTEQEEFRRVSDRLREVCQAGATKNVAILIDAEESWIQDPVDALVNKMIMVFNKEKPVVYNTLQMYRHDRLQYLMQTMPIMKEAGVIYALKLVRGAYMEKERARATQMGYPSPIQPDKQTCDKDFDAAVTMCIENYQQMAIFCASHNEQSAKNASTLMKLLNIPANHPHIYFSQLFGMSDHITFNLANGGYNTAKYLPFGPVKDVMPYLIRRAQENTSISGQMSRELKLISEEKKRRGI